MRANDKRDPSLGLPRRNLRLLNSVRSKEMAGTAVYVRYDKGVISILYKRPG